MKATVAKNGQQGFEIFQKSTPYYFAGILMDIRMPVMDGLTATRSIRQLDRDDARTIPIIAMSGNAYQEDVTKAKTAGMDAYLTKPVIPGLLYRTLAEWIK
jgi:CheY-like chemotaxis protein